MEQELLARARVGDQAAFGRLVALHREAVYRAAYFVLEDVDEALDATQEAFLRAFRHIERFEGRSSFRTWARRIATNTALDRRARRRRDRLAAQALPEGDEVLDPRGEDVDAALLRAERADVVRAAIETLPEAQRAAVLLRDVAGLSYAEIGESLGIPRGTVMSRIHYGRTALKERLEPLLGPRALEVRVARSREAAP